MHQNVPFTKLDVTIYFYGISVQYEHHLYFRNAYNDIESIKQ